MNTAPPATTSVSVTAQITQLPDLSMSDIKSIWKELFHADTPTHNRQFLERRIAYRLQRSSFGKSTEVWSTATNDASSKFSTLARTRAGSRYSDDGWHRTHQNTKATVPRHGHHGWPIRSSKDGCIKACLRIAKGDHGNSMVRATVLWLEDLRRQNQPPERGKNEQKFSSGASAARSIAVSPRTNAWIRSSTRSTP